MGKFLLVTCVFFSFLAYSHAGEIYICIDSHGVKTIASEPQKSLKCELAETFSDPTPQEMTKREETKKQKAMVEQNKKASDDCYENVKQQYKKAVNERCQARKLPQACSLPPEDMQTLEDAYQKANNKCAELSEN